MNHSNMAGLPFPEIALPGIILIVKRSTKNIKIILRKSKIIATMTPVVVLTKKTPFMKVFLV